MDRAGGKRKENLVVSLFSCQLLRSFPPFVVFFFFVFYAFSCSPISFLCSYLALTFSHLKCPWSAAMLANVTWWKGGISSNFFFLLFFFSFFASVPSLAHSHPFKNSLTSVHYANEWLTGVMGSTGLWRGAGGGEGDKDEQNQ